MKFFKTLLLISLLSFTFPLSSCYTNNSSSNENTFKTLETSEELNEQYSNISLDTVFRVDFNKDIKFDTNGQDRKRAIEFDSMDLTEISNNRMFTVIEGVKKVTGKLYISIDKRSLIFVPDNFLQAGKKYKVILSKRIASIDNTPLGNNFQFTASTKNEELLHIFNQITAHSKMKTLICL